MCYMRRDQRGFTLMELVITMGITTLMAAFFVMLARDTTDSTLRFSSQLITQQAIEQTLQLIVPEIRSIAQGIDGAYPVSTATTSTFAFYSDIDVDGKFDKVRYFMSSSSTLSKGVIKPVGSTYPTSSEQIVDLVAGIVPGTAIFAYYDSSATSSASSALPLPVDVLRVKTVKVTIIADQGTPGHPSLVGSETSATIRNLRFQ